MEKFHDHLAGLDRLEDVLAHRGFLDAGDQLLRHAELHVRLEQRDADLAEGVGDVFIGNFADTTEVAEGLVEVVAEGGEHGETLNFKL